jgi:hypothetical protein
MLQFQATTTTPPLNTTSPLFDDVPLPFVAVAGVCSGLAILISLWLIYKHLRNYTEPRYVLLLSCSFITGGFCTRLVFGCFVFCLAHEASRFQRHIIRILLMVPVCSWLLFVARLTAADLCHKLMVWIVLLALLGLPGYPSRLVQKCIFVGLFCCCVCLWLILVVTATRHTRSINSSGCKSLSLEVRTSKSTCAARR